MPHLGGSPEEIQVWWHGVAALPAGRQDHAYHALRRVWGDHTMAGGRGFYRPRSEDHLTLALFQNWAMLPDLDWVASLVAAIGGVAGAVTRARWAYACEELLDSKLRPYHGRDFVIPDIMLVYEDDDGIGLIVFEVKGVGKRALEEDSRKLRTYTDLPSTRRIKRRYGCILVSANAAQKSSEACKGIWPVLTWERLGELQLAAVRKMQLPEMLNARVSGWVGRQFKRYGIQIAGTGDAPEPCGIEYGTEDGYLKVDALTTIDSLRRFLKGSECVEAVWSGKRPTLPLPWLADEPPAEIIRQRKWQTKEDRRICRWNFDWTFARERTWR